MYEIIDRYRIPFVSFQSYIFKKKLHCIQASGIILNKSFFVLYNQ